MRRPYRVKLVLPTVQDTQMFYAETRDEADEIVATFEREVLPEVPDGRVYVYVDTRLGHVRIR